MVAKHFQIMYLVTLSSVSVICAKESHKQSKRPKVVQFFSISGITLFFSYVRKRHLWYKLKYMCTYIWIPLKFHRVFPKNWSCGALLPSAFVWFKSTSSEKEQLLRERTWKRVSAHLFTFLAINCAPTKHKNYCVSFAQESLATWDWARVVFFYSSINQHGLNTPLTMKT